MSLSDVNEQIVDSINEYVEDYLVSEIVDSILLEARQNEIMYPSFAEFSANTSFEYVFDDVLSEHENGVDECRYEAISDSTIDGSDCDEIITEYGIMDAYKRYVKDSHDISSVSSLAYYICVEECDYYEPSYYTFEDSILENLAEAWDEWYRETTAHSVETFMSLIQGLNLRTLAYDDGSIRVYSHSSDLEFVLLNGFYLKADSLAIKLSYIWYDEYNERLVFYNGRSEITTMEL